MEDCKECGNNEFTKKDGKYFCDECGTELESAREIEFDNEFVEENQAKVKKTVVRKQSNKGEPLTTWDRFNVLLYELVADVEKTKSNLKRDFKLTVLQLWTAYLRYHEKAFDSKEFKLPNIDAAFRPSDLSLHNISKAKKKPTSAASTAQTESTKPSKRTKFDNRERKRKQTRLQKKIDQNTLSGHATMDATNFLDQENEIEKSSSKPIAVTFTERAKENLKRIMSEDHIQEHEENPLLDCHKFKRKHYSNTTFETDQLVRTSLYCLLYMALNHIEEDIQLGDIIRYIREGHIMLQNGITRLSDEPDEATSLQNQIRKGLGTSPSHQYLRFACFQLMKEIDFEFTIPDMSALCKRYIEELCLPSDIHNMIDVLLHTCPPNMNAEHERNQKSAKIPNFEARAVAYIIFMLKLLFGLDDEREHLISSSSRTLNDKIASIESRRQKLFVWDDWVEYIEMREHILIQCHFPTAMKSNPNSDSMTHLYVDYLSQMRNDEDGVEHRAKLRTFRGIQDIFQKLDNDNPSDSTKTPLLFYPSLTPKTSYMNALQSHNLSASNIFIPKFMNVRHNHSDIQSFLKPSNLKLFFSENQIELVINKLKCSKNIKFTGKFTEAYKYFYLRDHQKNTAYSFNTTTDEWLLKLKEQQQAEANTNQRSNEAEAMNEKLIKIKENHRKAKELKKKRRWQQNETENTQTQTTSINYSSNPIPTDKFDCVSTDDEEEAEIPLQPLETLSLNITNFDYWMLHGFFFLSQDDWVDVTKKTPKSFQWLLKVCAELIENSEGDLYKELMVVENYFANCLKPFDEMTDSLLYQPKGKNSTGGYLYRKY